MSGLPQSLEYERLILGACLLYPECLHAARPVLELEDFSIETHRRIWKQICGLYDAGVGVDYLTAYQALKMQGQHESVGGLTYLVSLTDGVPQLPNLDSYVNGVQEKTILRNLIAASQSIIDRCISGTDRAQDIVESLGQVAMRLVPQVKNVGLQSAGEIIDEVGISRILRPRRESGLPFPWPWMNYRTGGMLPAELWVLAGHTSTGKTSAMLQHAVTLARQGKGVAIFSLEVGKESLLQKAIYQLSRVDSELGKRGKLDAEQRKIVTDAANEIHHMPIFLDTQSTTPMAIHAAVRRMRLKHHIDHVIVDYLQLLGSTVKADNRAREVGSNAWAMKMLATDFQVPVLLLSQFSRQSNKPGSKREPDLTDLKESGDIENHANGVWFIHRPSDDDSNQIPVRFMLAKQRDGRRNVWQDFYFFPQFQRFEEVSEERYE